MLKLKKITDFIKSLRFRLILLFFLFGIVPCSLLRQGMLQSYVNRAVFIQSGEILSQAKILGNQIVSNDYFNSKDTTMIDVQLNQLSTIYDGRVMIIDGTFRIIRDTYGIDEGKTIISEEVIKSYHGEEISKYDSENHYIEMTIPLIYERPSEETKNIIGVVMISVSTDSINLNFDYLSRNTQVMELIVIVVIVLLGMLAAMQTVKPFYKMSRSIEEIRSGYGGDTLEINDYTEMAQISE
ncbi:MAG: two-component sensor histidine kinase, partial [Clostridiales bacterium]|nr:two-component sensor histidine kinase [Clostridiales bacterium]